MCRSWWAARMLRRCNGEVDAAAPMATGFGKMATLICTSPHTPVGMSLREAIAMAAALSFRSTRPRLWQRQCANPRTPLGMSLPEPNVMPAALSFRSTRPRLWQRQCANPHYGSVPFGTETPTPLDTSPRTARVMSAVVWWSLRRQRRVFGSARAQDGTPAH